MIDCRSISPETWEHARKALVFYFSRRCGLTDAEDRAQETLAAIWRRADFDFQSEADFLKVCYGFARRIWFEALRDARKHAAAPLDPNLPVPDDGRAMRSIESKVLLEEVRHVAEQQLRDDEWGLIWKSAMQSDPTGPSDRDPRTLNRMRVRLHRVRNKLAELTSWRRK